MLGLVFSDGAPSNNQCELCDVTVEPGLRWNVADDRTKCYPHTRRALAYKRQSIT